MRSCIESFLYFPYDDNVTHYQKQKNDAITLQVCNTHIQKVISIYTTNASVLYAENITRPDLDTYTCCRRQQVRKLGRNLIT